MNSPRPNHLFSRNTLGTFLPVALLGNKSKTVEVALEGEIKSTIVRVLRVVPVGNTGLSVEIYIYFML